MIKAMVFDLDGTLVQTEKLKARSYAKAAVALCLYELDEDEVVEAFKDVVGRSRREVALLREARDAGCNTSLATMSHSSQVQLVLGVLALTEAFDFVATRDDVENGKPDPEIYQLISRELGIVPGDCLVIEDSPSGVQAALAAGMKVVAVATPFTRDRLH